MRHTPLRPSADHRGILAVPPLSTGRRLVESNRQRLSGSPLGVLTPGRQVAVREAIEAARTWMQQHDLMPPDTATTGLVVTGHQPGLFHPGVWIKNFAAARLASELGLTPVNLIVDNDVAKSVAMPVPAFRADSAAKASVAMDRFAGPTPYESLAVRDEVYLAGLPGRVAEAMGEVGFTPMLDAFWRDVLEARRITRLLGERLAIARHRTEERWGCRILELPLSGLCQTSSFSSFAGEILRDLPRFHVIHNDCLNAYRRAHRIRSRSHPVADLARDGEWLEAPFWVWNDNSPRRERPFARQTDGRSELRVGERTFPLELTLGQMTRVLAAGGWKLRTRALTTTMFVRVYLADLFIHGIGGAAYDELTDAIIRDFLGIDPPEFLVLSGTLYLPFPERDRGRPDPQQHLRALRDLFWNPDRHLPAHTVLEDRQRALIGEKRKLIAEAPVDHAIRAGRFLRLREINAELRPLVAAAGAELESQLASASAAAQRWRIAHDRELPFVLFPETALRDWFLERMG